jgi:hypothetical protein
LHHRLLRATSWPGTQRHLVAHPDLAHQIDTVTAHTDQARRQTQRRRDGATQ